MEELFINTSFGKVFAVASGDGSHPVILAIHGWSQRNGWHTWKALMNPLAEAGYRVVSVDMPGWGQSIPVVPGSLGSDDAVRAALELLDMLKADTAVVMGKSWGGGVGISMALSAPKRVGRLILTAPAYRELDRLPALAQPVLMAWSKDDPVIPFQYAGSIAGAIPTCQLEVYEQGGHSAATYNAADFAPKAIRFLKG